MAISLLAAITSLSWTLLQTQPTSAFLALPTWTSAPKATAILCRGTPSNAALGPTLDQTMAAANYVQSQLEQELRSKETHSQCSHSPQTFAKLEDLHSIALTLMEFGDDVNLDKSSSSDDDIISPMKRAADLFRYSLNNFGDSPAIRERLSAALRSVGQIHESAEELYAVIHSLEGGSRGKNNVPMIDDETLCMLYLDLGFLIEEISPLPGAGFDLQTMTNGEWDVPRLKFQSGEGSTESLSALDCYRRAVDLDPACGLGHKKLADALAILGQDEEAVLEFQKAAEYLPEDICCATHLHFANNMRGESNAKAKSAIPLNESLVVGKTLEEICVSTEGLKNESTVSLLAETFEVNGVLVLQKMVENDEVQLLLEHVKDIITSSATADGHPVVSDFTDETKAAKRRVHMALPLEIGQQTKIVSDLLCRLHPLLALILKCDHSGDGRLPLIGSGFMQTSPGASSQDLHKDVHHFDRHGPFVGMPESWDCNLNGQPRCISIQLQLTDTTLGGKMGSLEVLPGSHRPDAANGNPLVIGHAVDEPNERNGVISVDVPAGSVTIYSSRLWHRGGSNESDKDRLFCFFTVTEQHLESAPPGLIHTMQLEDVGRWSISGANGLE